MVFGVLNDALEKRMSAKANEARPPGRARNNMAQHARVSITGPCHAMPEVPELELPSKALATGNNAHASSELCKGRKASKGPGNVLSNCRKLSKDTVIHSLLVTAIGMD